MEGEIEVNADCTRASAPAGTSLDKLTDILWKRGASLINQGDVNPQALAGAIATGTHGTGATLGSMSTAARSFQLMTHDGSIVSCSPTENPDLFQAQRLSLGLMGIATRIEIDVLPAYHLEERLEVYPLSEISERWDQLAAENRHVEFFVFPMPISPCLRSFIQSLPKATCANRGTWTTRLSAACAISARHSRS